MSSSSEAKIPEEFEKIIKDLINDLNTTFPEYKVFINKWWKDDSYFDYIDEETERLNAIKKSQENSIQFIFKFCQRKFPPRFFDILYQNNDIFSENSDIDTEFLPQIHFKNLWECDISDKTRETIWKYLQLIMFSIVGSVHNKEAFGDTAKLFDSINEAEFKNKLEETLNEMQNIFNTNSEKTDESFEGINIGNIPNANDIHSHISEMLDGKLGKLAKEIAEETASELNMDMENVTDVKDVFQKLMSNPGKMMGLVKNVGDKLDNKLKSGEIKESELIAEASNIMNKMKNMPGMENIQEMLSKMGLGNMGLGKGAKMNYGAMEAQLDRNMKMAKTKERMQQKAKNYQESKLKEQNIVDNNQNFSQPQMSEEELIALFSGNDTNNSNSNNNTNKKKKNKSKK
jgi:hypothetical protein